MKLKKQIIEVETIEGVNCWKKDQFKSWFIYPGGTAPLFSTVLMLAVPASIAGCKEIVLVATKGNINPAILYAANLCGVTKILKVESSGYCWSDFWNSNDTKVFKF
jgi:histidinol dehydrogenase